MTKPSDPLSYNVTDVTNVTNVTSETEVEDDPVESEERAAILDYYARGDREERGVFDNEGNEYHF